MNQFSIKLQKLQEYSTPTTGGYYLSNFHTSDPYNGSKLFRLHFTTYPTTFDVTIHYSSDFVVDYKDRDQDTTRFHFADYESVVAYLTTK